MSRRSVGLFMAGFALVSIVSFRETALARFRRFHASACTSDSNAPTYGLPTEGADSKASGVLYGRTTKAVQLLCSVEDSSEFKVADMKILKVFVNDGNSGKAISARWCWSAVKGWTGACGSARTSAGKAPPVNAGSTVPASATPPAATPPDTDTTEELAWDDSNGLNPADHPWNGMRPTGFAYVYVQVPGKAGPTDMTLGFVGFSVYDAP